MRIPTALLALAVVVSTSSPGQAQAARSWDGVTASIEPAAVAGRADALRALRVECLGRLSASAGDREPMLRYAVAYIDWRLASLPGVAPQEAMSLLDDAVGQLQAAIKKRDAFAEAHALLASVYAVQIGTSRWKGMTLGPQAGRAIQTAVSLEPHNPRILLQHGVTVFRMPPMFGGSLEKAEQLLRRSLERFAQEPRNTPWPNWGRADAHAWLGQLLHRRGDTAGARAQYEAALKIAPGYWWVRDTLLPALAQDQKR